MFNPKHLAEKEIDVTIKMFRIIRRQRKRFELFISPVGIAEIGASPTWLAVEVFSLIRSLKFIKLPENNEANRLAQFYVTYGVLSKKHVRDLTHIAYATIARCDYIISWNFKHFVKLEINERVRSANENQNYASAVIYSPYDFIGEKPK
jgi:hypothetical protein